MRAAENTGEMLELLHAEIKDDIGVAVINDPHKANCLSSALLQGLLRAFDHFEKQRVRVAIIRAYPGENLVSGT